MLGHDENEEKSETEESEKNEEEKQQALINKKQRKIRHLLDQTKADWQVTILKLKRRRPLSNGKTLIEK